MTKAQRQQLASDAAWDQFVQDTIEVAGNDADEFNGVVVALEMMAARPMCEKSAWIRRLALVGAGFIGRKILQRMI
jgi:hypothetical protein